MAPALELRGITNGFGDLTALRGLDLQIHAGEVFGFVGSNGAGKTTTMRIVMGVLATDSGQVLWEGAPISFETRRRTGYMPEERGLYPKQRIAEQLTYFGRLHGLTDEQARTATLHWLDRLGLGARTRDELLKLSHGNQQRVQLAAALVFDPVLLILDEPFAGLDPEAVDSMSAILREQAAAGRPVIFSSHQLELVERLCDRVGIIRRGELIACGPVDELRGAGPERLRVDAPGAPEGWAAAIPGVTVVGREGTSVLLELAGQADDQQVLRRALETGPVREFHRQRPTLLELFREYVSGRETDAA